MTWAARYSRTEEPELTIWRDGETFARFWPCFPTWEADDYIRRLEIERDPDLRADIAARVPVTECEEPGCVNWAMPDGRCHHLHGGSDEL